MYVFFRNICANLGFNCINYINRSFLQFFLVKISNMMKNANSTPLPFVAATIMAAAIVDIELEE